MSVVAGRGIDSRDDRLRAGRWRCELLAVACMIARPRGLFVLVLERAVRAGWIVAVWRGSCCRLVNAPIPRTGDRGSVFAGWGFVVVLSGLVSAFLPRVGAAHALLAAAVCAVRWEECSAGLDEKGSG